MNRKEKLLKLLKEMEEKLSEWDDQLETEFSFFYYSSGLDEKVGDLYCLLCDLIEALEGILSEGRRDKKGEEK